MVFQPAQHWESGYEAHVGRSELSEEFCAIPGLGSQRNVRAACAFVRCGEDTRDPSMMIPEPSRRLLALLSDPIEP